METSEKWSKRLFSSEIACSIWFCSSAKWWNL